MRMAGSGIHEGPVHLHRGAKGKKWRHVAQLGWARKQQDPGRTPACKLHPNKAAQEPENHGRLAWAQ